MENHPRTNLLSWEHEFVHNSAFLTLKKTTNEGQTTCNATTIFCLRNWAQLRNGDINLSSDSLLFLKLEKQCWEHCSTGFNLSHMFSCFRAECPENTYKSDIGMEMCTPCPAHSSSARGSVSKDACVCSHGRFVMPGIKHGTCQEYQNQEQVELGESRLVLPKVHSPWAGYPTFDPVFVSLSSEKKDFSKNFVRVLKRDANEYKRQDFMFICSFTSFLLLQTECWIKFPPF